MSNTRENFITFRCRKASLFAFIVALACPAGDIIVPSGRHSFLSLCLKFVWVVVTVGTTFSNMPRLQVSLW